jgi:NAD(P)-dependent dehydrogenase (short-subunit alcohol dehydrogenase family)
LGIICIFVFQVVGCQLAVVSCQLAVGSWQLSVVGCQLSVVGCRFVIRFSNPEPSTQHLEPGTWNMEHGTSNLKPKTWNKKNTMANKKKQSIIITGAAGNLGRVVVEKLVAEGYHIIATIAPGNESPFKNLKSVDSEELDLTDEAAVESFVKKCYGKYDKIHAGVLIAGGFDAGGLKDTDKAKLDKQIALNFETAYHLSRQLFIRMEDGGGHLIFVGTRPAFTPSEGKNLVAYSLAKSLLFRLAEIINADGKDKNIRASVIVPGTIDTPANREAMPDADHSKWVPRTDIAEALTYLVSEPGGSLRETVLKLYNES